MFWAGCGYKVHKLSECYEPKPAATNVNYCSHGFSFRRLACRRRFDNSSIDYVTMSPGCRVSVQYHFARQTQWVGRWGNGWGEGPLSQPLKVQLHIGNWWQCGRSLAIGAFWHCTSTGLAAGRGKIPFKQPWPIISRYCTMQIRGSFHK